MKGLESNPKEPVLEPKNQPLKYWESEPYFFIPIQRIRTESEPSI
jgi:hypothetical protein